MVVRNGLGERPIFPDNRRKPTVPPPQSQYAMRYLLSACLLFVASTLLHAQDSPLSPPEAVKRMTVPEGFRVRLYAAEPHVLNPIAMTLDDRGRLWVIESHSYP